MPQGPNVDGTTADTVIRPPAETATLPQVATVSPSEPVAQTISQPAPAPKVAETGPPKPFDLGAVVASIEIPVSEQQSKVVPVDIKKIKPQPAKADAATVAKADSAKDAKAKAALSKANAARHWVQIATGSDMNGLAFDYRRMAKKSSALFEGKEGWTAAWGKSRRLLVGPFDDMKTAKKWEADFRKAGGDGFAWKSAEWRGCRQAEGQIGAGLAPTHCAKAAAMTTRASYACQPEHSRGRLYPEPGGEARGPRNIFQRDRDRIIHSIAFRRLRHKTQVFVAPDGDHYRVRLTHSLEVAQIGRTIARALGLDEDLTEALCLAHDIGHPPFGHAGEDALEAAMAPYGGFDHNAQTLADFVQARKPVSAVERAQPQLGIARRAGQA